MCHDGKKYYLTHRPSTFLRAKDSWLTRNLDTRGAGWKRARKKQACGEIGKLQETQRPK